MVAPRLVLSGEAVLGNDSAVACQRHEGQAVLARRGSVVPLGAHGLLAAARECEADLTAQLHADGLPFLRKGFP